MAALNRIFLKAKPSHSKSTALSLIDRSFTCDEGHGTCPGLKLWLLCLSVWRVLSESTKTVFKRFNKVEAALILQSSSPSTCESAEKLPANGKTSRGCCLPTVMFLPKKAIYMYMNKGRIASNWNHQRILDFFKACFLNQVGQDKKNLAEMFTARLVSMSFCYSKIPFERN